MEHLRGIKEYQKIIKEINNIKKNIIYKIVGEVITTDDKTPSFFTTNYSNIGKNWNPKEIYRDIIYRSKNVEVNDRISNAEADAINVNILRSNDIIRTLSHMLQYKNTSKINGYYFNKLSESTLDKIAEILGDDYTPKNNKGQEKNIQLAYERIEKMKKERN